MIRRKRNLTGRVLATALVLVFGAVSASAYTLVLRDGRRVEIPNNFTLTTSTLTYEISDGMQVTVQLNTVDVAATERANGEAAGALLRRAGATQSAVESVAPTRRGTAQRSITNADLERYRRARVESERSRKELGLPSMDERRNEVAAIQERTLEQVRNMRQQQELEQESLWRARADLLRAQMEATGNQFDNRRFAGDYPWAGETFFPFDGFGFDTGIGRFGRFNRLPVSLFPGFLSTP